MMFMPWFPPSENLTGTFEPAFCGFGPPFPASGGPNPPLCHVTLTVAVLVTLWPPGSVPRTLIVRLVGATSPAAENVAVWPAVSKVPSLLRSQTYVIAWFSGSLPVAETWTVPPCSTAYGPPALTVGGRSTGGVPARVGKVAVALPVIVSGGSLLS